MDFLDFFEGLPRLVPLGVAVLLGGMISYRQEGCSFREEGKGRNKEWIDNSNNAEGVFLIAWKYNMAFFHFVSFSLYVVPISETSDAIEL